MNIVGRLSKSFAFSLLLVVGCTTVPKDAPLFSGLSPQPLDAANVYLLRPHNDFGYAVSPVVFFNGTKVVTLPDSTYTVFRVPAGVYAITTERAQWWSGGWDVRGELKAENGQAYFLVLDRETKQHSGVVVVGTTPSPTLRTEVLNEGWVPYYREDATRMLARLRFVKPEIKALAN